MKSENRNSRRDAENAKIMKSDIEFETMMKTKCYRIILISTGILAVILGAAGIFLPLLPTTPFLLLAAACFMRSSEKLYLRLINHRWLGSFIRNYREHKAITLRAKVYTLLLLWLSLGYTVIWVIQSMWLRFLCMFIGFGVTLHVAGKKTLQRESQSPDTGL